MNEKPNVLTAIMSAALHTVVFYGVMALGTALAAKILSNLDGFNYTVASLLAGAVISYFFTTWMASKLHKDVPTHNLVVTIVGVVYCLFGAYSLYLAAGTGLWIACAIYLLAGVCFILARD